MDVTGCSRGGSRHFSLKSLFIAVALMLVVCGFVVQQSRIQILTAERTEAQTSRRIMLFCMPGGGTANARMAMWAENLSRLAKRSSSPTVVINCWSMLATRR